MNDRYKLPYTYNISGIKEQLQQLPADTWIPHYNTNDYEGEWDVIALRSGWGHPTNIYSVPMPASSYQDTPLLAQFEGVKQILDGLLCEKTSVRFMRLRVGADIKEHCDDELDIAQSKEARLHIPIQTDTRVEFYLNHERVIMQEGECWYLNFNLPHSVKNPGPVDRIHLVIDCVVNDWLREQMNLPGQRSA